MTSCTSTVTAPTTRTGLFDGNRRMAPRDAASSTQALQVLPGVSAHEDPEFRDQKIVDCLLAGTPRIPWSQGNERFLLSDSHNALHAPVITHFIQAVLKITDFKELRTWML